SVCARYLSPHVAAFKPDLILNYGVYPEGGAAIGLGKALGIPVVLGAIGSDLNRIPDPATKWLTRRALRQASYVFAVSKQLRYQAIGLGASPDRTLVIQNGCDTSLFRLADRDAARAELKVDPQPSLVLF